jgi:HJR/Mrr/RecB family endonuclease
MLALSAIIGVIRAIAGISAAHRSAQQERALQIEDVDVMDGLAFEHYVAGLLRDRGYAATVTPGSGDLGVDVIAEQAGIRYAVQVKRYSGAVSRRAISDVVGVLVHYRCTVGMIITNRALC